MNKIAAYEAADGTLFRTKVEAFRHDNTPKLQAVLRREWDADDLKTDRLTAVLVDHAEEVVSCLIGLTSHAKPSD